jgi:hypothetical protein
VDGRATRAFATWLAVGALALRAIMPMGWMPNPQAASDGVPLVICTLEGAQTLLIGADGVPRPAEGVPAKASDHAPCHFACAGHTAPPRGGVELPVLAVWSEPLAPAALSVAFSRLDGRIAEPRGPPALA